ncbi:MAG: L-serine ammonia-lyase, iron-sulfur-dependent, subunit alpha [Clostridiales bacterium]|uniref:L-cysteine desulfidase family protein n=1 Tax=Terrisporobacter sp. TaxID=1965305 RepID=UPI002A54A58D|nr:L-serine ammonia-lyase, iron-sulfur-dependent, subunit alpha [Terrisporobacter sp.]MDD7754734.1 L-serine ammonia-lyase, iron-sulfur-dependent, subunit alpha [Clostridiales bacterium]MDY4134931.1 L-serine ammonia-lyase, iron-sulfur-dependent, subunit alpha [Terrisporobacter sp.]
MRDLRTNLIDILKAEVKPAVGCTEPVAVALACAKAKELLGEEVVKNKILVSPNVYKNAMCVGIPGTDRLGLKIAVAMGLVGGKSEDGLTLLEGLNEEQVRESERYVDTTPISIEPLDTKEKVVIDVTLEGENNKSRVIIKTKHDNFVFIQQNDLVLLDQVDGYAEKDEVQTEEKKENIMDNITIQEIVTNIENMDLEDIKFLLDGIEMNTDMAKYGLENKIGIGVGRGIKESIEEGLLGDGIMTKAMLLTAAASDARMGGAKLPVMSSNGSGNHGLTAILPIVAYAQKYPQSDEKMAKALAISHLITAYVKNFTGRLSAVCGCGVAASTGASAGISWLMDGNINHIYGAIENMIADLSGMICDGAKAGCALKLSSAASAAVQSAVIAKQGYSVPALNGIVGTRVEESIQNLGRVSDKGMQITDEIILNVMNDMNKVK